MNNFAYIDGANLHKALKELGWDLDYKKFRIWLKEKYKDLYNHLQSCGFTLLFKDVIYDGAGKPKGNCDADLVLQVTIDHYENNVNQAIIVSSDGDYAGLVKFLMKKKKIKALISPSTPQKYSILLKRTGVPILYLSDKKSLLKKGNEKAPNKDGTS